MLIRYLRIEPKLDFKIFQELLKELPDSMIRRNKRFVKYEDQQRNLFGLLLLKKLWLEHHGTSLELTQLKKTDFQRPYLTNWAGDFNISHAGDFVICALNPNGAVGIDIEYIKQVDFGDFTITMNDQQWLHIKESDNPVERFFQYWTMKESLIKIDGRGLSIPLTDIIIKDFTVTYEDKLWYLKPFALDKKHCGCLASATPKKSLNLVKTSLHDLN